MKKILTICFAISAFSISGALLLKSIQEKGMSDPLFLANVAALATAEDDCGCYACDEGFYLDPSDHCCKALLRDGDVIMGDCAGGAPTCVAGGCHAKQCSFSGQIEILGNGITYTNSIECDDAWACCFTTAYCFPKNLCSW